MKVSCFMNQANGDGLLEGVDYAIGKEMEIDDGLLFDTCRE